MNSGPEAHTYPAVLHVVPTHKVDFVRAHRAADGRHIGSPVDIVEQRQHLAKGKLREKAKEVYDGSQAQLLAFAMTRCEDTLTCSPWVNSLAGRGAGSGRPSR